jgi:hypothetical protein
VGCQCSSKGYEVQNLAMNNHAMSAPERRHRRGGVFAENPMLDEGGAETSRVTTWFRRDCRCDENRRFIDRI